MWTAVNVYFRKRCENADVRCQPQSLLSSGAEATIAGSIAHARSVYDNVLCVYERFRVDGIKRYVNDDRLRVDGDKNMRLLAFAFTIVFVWTGP